jgi:phage gpG-like protein
MAEMRVELRGFDTPVGVLRRLEKNLENLTPLKRKLGEIVREAIKGYIKEGGTPDGDFAPTFDKYAKLEGKGHDRPLWWTGDLYNSIVDALTSHGVAVGSTEPYAPWVLLADGSTARHYAREEVNGQWVSRGQVIERASSFTPMQPGFVPRKTVIQKREALRLFMEDVANLLKWLEQDLLIGATSARA